MRLWSWGPVLAYGGCVLLALAFVVFLLFHGDLDFWGHYRVLESVPSPSNKLALKVLRSDDTALNSDLYFVVIADRAPNVVNLRRAAHDWGSRFLTTDPDFSLQWIGPNLLEVHSDHWLGDQPAKMDGVPVRYVDPSAGR